MLNQLAIEFPTDGLTPLDEEQLFNIRKDINRRWKGMAGRANYQDLSEAVGVALRATGLSVEDKREFAINVCRSLHKGRTLTFDMSVDHICRVAGLRNEDIIIKWRSRA